MKMVVVCSNQDVLTELLLLLPVKPLLTFKCVSKQWLSLITDPNFCSPHTQIKKSRPNSLLITNNNSVLIENLVANAAPSTPRWVSSSKTPFLDYLNQDGVCILHSSNGLILCSSVPEKQIYVCNPATKQFKTLVYLGPGSYNLAFDPHKLPHYEAFNEISSREMEKINVFKGILQNYVFVVVLSATVIFQIIIVEFLGTFANTSPLTWQQWFVSVFFGFLGMPIAAAIKMISVGSN